MLVDTGAFTSIHPRSRITTSHLSTSKHHLGGARIECYSSRMIPLQRRRFTWDLKVADVKKPILGADFLTAHGLVVCLQWGCLTSNDNEHLVLPCSLHVLSSNGDFSINWIHCLLEEEFHDIAGLPALPAPAARLQGLPHSGNHRNRPHPL